MDRDTLRAMRKIIEGRLEESPSEAATDKLSDLLERTKARLTAIQKEYDKIGSKFSEFASGVVGELIRLFTEATVDVEKGLSWMGEQRPDTWDPGEGEAPKPKKKFTLAALHCTPPKRAVMVAGKLTCK